MSRALLSGTTCCCTTNVPIGSSTSAAPAGSLRSATPCVLRLCTLQLVALESAFTRSPSKSTAGGNVGGYPSTSVLSKRTEKSHQKISNEALPLTRSGRGPSSSPSSDTENRLLDPCLSCTLAWKSAIKCSGTICSSTS